MAALRSARGVGEDSARRAKKKKQDAMPEESNGSRPAGNRAGRYAADDAGQAVTSPRAGGGGKVGSAGLAPELASSESIRPRSSFGQQYIGASYPDLWTNPEVLAGDWMGGQGITPQGGGGMWKVYSDLAQVMPQLFQLTQGTGGPKGATFASFLDYANQFLNQYSTPGAGTVSPSVVGNLFTAGDNSPLGAMLNNPQLDPAQQANLLLGLMGAGLATSMPGATAGGYLGNAEAMAQQWMGEKAKGKGGTFQDYLASQGYADLFR